MPIENKKNHENEEIHEDKLDHWYGSLHKISIAEMMFTFFIISVLLFIVFNILGLFNG